MRGLRGLHSKYSTCARDRGLCTPTHQTLALDLRPSDLRYRLDQYCMINPLLLPGLCLDLFAVPARHVTFALAGGE